jgi:hypothetical protein
MIAAVALTQHPFRRSTHGSAAADSSFVSLSGCAVDQLWRWFIRLMFIGTSRLHSMFSRSRSQSLAVF